MNGKMLSPSGNPIIVDFTNDMVCGKEQAECQSNILTTVNTEMS